MNSFVVLFALAVAPGTYLAIATYLRDKYEPEPKRLLAGAFWAGCMMIIPAALIEFGGIRLLHCNGPGISNALIMAFLLVAPAEEAAKFWVLRYYAYPKREFSEPLDGIVYGVFVALGFATAENLLYVLQHGFVVGVLRMFLSVPTHYTCGVIMGYYVGKAKFEEQNRSRYLLRGVLYAMIIHGAFDALILQKIYPALFILTPVVLIIALRIAHREIKELQADSMGRCNEKPPVIQPIPLDTREL